MQWDPDYTPTGDRVERRAIQLGLQREAAVNYSREWILGIEDISEFVEEQRQHVIAKNYAALLTPSECVYEVGDRGMGDRLQILG